MCSLLGFAARRLVCVFSHLPRECSQKRQWHPGAIWECFLNLLYTGAQSQLHTRQLRSLPGLDSLQRIYRHRRFIWDASCLAFDEQFPWSGKQLGGSYQFSRWGLEPRGSMTLPLLTTRSLGASLTLIVSRCWLPTGEMGIMGPYTQVTPIQLSGLLRGSREPYENHFIFV